MRLACLAMVLWGGVLAAAQSPSTANAPLHLQTSVLGAGTSVYCLVAVSSERMAGAVFRRYSQKRTA